VESCGGEKEEDEKKNTKIKVREREETLGCCC
jgi:hypothetical protein